MTTRPILITLAAAAAWLAPAAALAHPGHVGPHLAQPGVGAVAGTAALTVALILLNGPGRRVLGALRGR